MKRIINLLAVAWIFAAGCATPSGNSPIGDCASWKKAVEYYDAMRATGLWNPSEDEVRAEKMARAMLQVACGNMHLAPVPPGTKGLVPPRQPEVVVCGGIEFRKVMDWKIIQDPTGVFRSPDYGLATVTVGAFYQGPDDGPTCFRMLPLDYERGLTDEVRYMQRVGCW